MTGFSDPVAGRSANQPGMSEAEVSQQQQPGAVPLEESGHSQGEISQAASEGIKAAGGVDDESLIIDETEGGGESGEVTNPDDLEPPPPPALREPPTMSTLVDLTGLLSALQLTEQKQQAEKTVTEIKAEAKDRAVKSDEEIQKVKDKITEMNKAGILKLFTKIFSAIGAVLGMIAGALSIAAGVAMGGNPLLIAGGVLAMVASLDALMSVASDGKVSITAGITKALEAMGVDSETAGWIAFGIQMAMVAATLALGLMSGGAGTAGAMANLGAMVARSTKVLSLVQTAVQAAASGIGIGKGVVDSAVKDNEAETLEIQSVLKTLEKKIESLQQFLEEMISRLSDLVDSATALVEEKAKALAAIQRGVMT